MTIIKSDGLTESEKLLNLLCHKSFLSLWTYPNLFRDQGKMCINADGKEVCDAIAVFSDHILIFSDKSCTFPDSGSLDTDWGRWYKNAIKKSVDQLLGAKRWIKQHPDRLFIDKSCTEPLPIQLPTVDKMKIHLIAVARGAGERCRQQYGGSGSLMIFAPRLEKEAMANGRKLPPFSVGATAPTGEYVHVLDDVTAEIVLGTLDTASDLIKYLTEKEQFVTSSYFKNASGEEELLAYYMQSWSESGDLSFIIPAYKPPQVHPGLSLTEGLWLELISSTTWRSLQDWRKTSYFWDNLIDTFAFHTLDGTLYKVDDANPKYQETLLRFLAAEPRHRRQILSLALLGQLQRAPVDEKVDFSARYIVSSNPVEPTYIFLVVGLNDDETHLDYRTRRRDLLIKYCMVIKNLNPNCDHIIGIGIEPKDIKHRSEDLIYFDATKWTSDMASDAAELHAAGILKNIQATHSIEEPRHYPHAQALTELQEIIAIQKPERNDPCPCGSGIKYKKCHGR